MPTDTISVLIVGAGPAGLVSALFLAKSGIKVRIIDKAEKHGIGSRGFGIQPRTFELFQTLGIMDDIMDSATPIPMMRAYKIPGGVEPVKTWDMYEHCSAWPDRPYANPACLGQDTLEGILRRHLAQHGISVELGNSLVGVEQNTDHVLATISSPKSGRLEQESIKARYLVGADGARGASRKLLGLTFQGETRNADGQVWGDVRIEGLSTEFWHAWGKPGCFSILARPTNLRGDTFHIGITGQNFDPKELANPSKAVEFICKETGRKDLKFGEWMWISYFKPNMRMVNKFQEGRAFVVGDSAHVHSPSGGQGMNCSTQDASNLAWKLNLVLKGLAKPTLLSTYEEERIPVIAQILQTTTQLYTHTVPPVDSGNIAKAIESKSESDSWSSKGVETSADSDTRSGWFRWRNTALAMYGINYRFSSIVLNQHVAHGHVQPLDVSEALAHAYAGYEGSGSLCAGDRAPDAPGLFETDADESRTQDQGQLPMSVSLFGLLDPAKHTVLVFNANSDSVRTAALAGVLLRLQNDVVQTFDIRVGSITRDALNVNAENDVTGLSGQFGWKAYDDRERYAHSAYVVPKGKFTVVIIRPDSFIGAIVDDVDGVNRYFAKILG